MMLHLYLDIHYSCVRNGRPSASLQPNPSLSVDFLPVCGECVTVRQASWPDGDRGAELWRPICTLCSHHSGRPSTPMSFSNFRLQPLSVQVVSSPDRASDAESSLSQALGALGDDGQQGSAKRPYGSGDVDDGYTLVFESMDAFQAWRLREEEEKMIEFVKGDTHGSKAVPPRFKDHTKLVCARHSRSGRKKYVKKYPDRVRKVPSRKVRGCARAGRVEAQC